MSDPSGEPAPLPIPRDPEPVTKSPDAQPGGAAVPPGHGGDILMALLNLHPFMGYFCWLADRQYGDAQPSYVRVARLRKRTKRSTALYTLCVFLDMLLTLVVTVGLLALALTIAAKAVWPPPWSK